MKNSPRHSSSCLCPLIDHSIGGCERLETDEGSGSFKYDSKPKEKPSILIYIVAKLQGCGFRINDLTGKKTATSIIFILRGPLALLTSLAPLIVRLVLFTPSLSLHCPIPKLRWMHIRHAHPASAAVSFSNTCHRACSNRALYYYTFVKF